MINTRDEQPSQLHWAVLHLASFFPKHSSKTTNLCLTLLSNGFLQQNPADTTLVLLLPGACTCAAACIRLQGKHRPTNHISSRQLGTGSISAPHKPRVTEKEPWQHGIPPALLPRAGDGNSGCSSCPKALQPREHGRREGARAHLQWPLNVTHATKGQGSRDQCWC